MDEGEVRRLLSWMRRKNRKIYLVCLFLALGLRVGEAVRLNRFNMDPECRTVTYQVEKTGKIHSRLIPSWMAAELRDWIQDLPLGQPFLFFAEPKNRRFGREHLHVRSINDYFSQARRELGLNHVYKTLHLADGRTQRLYRITPHTLRHFAVESIYEALEYDLKATADTIGHLDPATTQTHYLKNRQFREKEALHVFDRLKI
ncbi:site-specific integrase [Candidatus Micrarchaeota archaeon]|nr:site-specific integrase [Candidatus Micrarchaeota archaeon]